MQNENEQDFIPSDETITDNEEYISNESDDTVEENHVDVSELQKKLKTVEAQKEHWRKKATTQTQAPKQEQSVDSLSSKDLLSLMKAEVNEDDIDDVVEYATFKKISIADALKTSTVKAIIAEKNEYRKTAELSNTSNVRKGVTKVSDDTLVRKLNDGEVPSIGSEDAERLFWARRGGKR